jgi:hypothetical protein
LVITMLSVFAVAGHSRLSGPILFALPGSKTHGVHRDDLVVAAIWLVGMLLCLRLWRDADS